MLSAVIGLLRCPHCTAALSLAGASLKCSNGHAFDIARQGYVNLLSGDAHTGTADSLDMVKAREAFLSAGHFAGIRQIVVDTASDAVAEAKTDMSEGCVIDVGAGTGYYLAGVLDRLPSRVGLALDISKYAIRRAAKAHNRVGAVVCNAWGALPVRDGCAALVMSVFAPRNAQEFRRVLRPQGRLIVVTPTPHHLGELVAVLGLVQVDEIKQLRLNKKLGAHFALVRSATLEKPLALTLDEVIALVGMGPSARHLAADQLRRRTDRLGGASADPVSVTVSVAVSLYRPL